MTKGTKVTDREKVEAWRSKAIAEVGELNSRVADLLEGAKKLRANSARIVGKIADAAQELSMALANGIEDRHAQIMKELVAEHGRKKAMEMVDTDDYPDTSAEDEHDEELCGELDNLDVPDIDDLMAQATGSLDDAEDSLSKLLSGLRGIR
jgi:phage shock protein A